MLFWSLVFIIVLVVGMGLFKEVDDSDLIVAGAILIIAVLFVASAYFYYKGKSGVALGVPANPEAVNNGIFKLLGQAPASNGKVVVVVEDGNDVFCLWSDTLIDPNVSYVTKVTKEEEVESVSTKSVTRIVPTD
jgi:hypothetical protein